MKPLHAYLLGIITLIAVFTYSCKDDDDPTDLNIDWASIDLNNPAYVLPDYPLLPQLPIPPNNPLTVSGVELGRRLFYDPILSGNKTQACASCHAQGAGFVDKDKQFSTGIDGLQGKRNAMALINLAYLPKLFWDGRSPTMEDQALRPVTDPVEMHNTWENAVDDLMQNYDYRVRFYQAFGSKTIDKELVAKAIAQFERTLVSGNSRYDLANTPGSGVFFTDEEYLGYILFTNEKGDCFHCHTVGSNLFSDGQFHNNGLDSVANINDYVDKGYGAVSNNPEDNGYFRTPTLRNIELTAPYMHDGRFTTLEQVVDHYSDHMKKSANVDPIIKQFFDESRLDSTEKKAMVAFLKTLTDTGFVNNPAFKSPF